MNLYECIIDFSNSIKQKPEVQKLIEIEKRIEKLKKDTQYMLFFELVDSRKNLYFFAPNIAMQIVKKLYANNDFKVFPKIICEKIINNEEIKEYIKISTIVSNIVDKEITSLFGLNEIKRNAKEAYSYNKLVEKIGYIGYFQIIQTIAKEKEKLPIYSEERAKIIDPNIKFFPLRDLKKENIRSICKKGVSIEMIEAYEKTNFLMTIIERIIYSDIYDLIINVERDKISQIKTTEKSKIINTSIKFENSPIERDIKTILNINKNFYFTYSIKWKFSKEEEYTKYDCFSCKLDEKDSLLNISIIDSLELFNNTNN